MAPAGDLADCVGKLSIKRFSEKECRDAINGQVIPTALGLPRTIRGIRHYDAFATELRKAAPGFTRALNTRDIMSNRILVIDPAEEIPHCMWHPQTVLQKRPTDSWSSGIPR
ncbi:hypothetical protein AC579_9515 [Pseudocercospora musae]|uniref:Uncharacterized protein n=1 Tax=Pseudocercospora musae TaxID=113226 RepID=A0A139IN62_9PEZI|nr:hypothetical protein AC579_9515 [Pseudocercospora musae]